MFLKCKKLRKILSLSYKLMIFINQIGLTKKIIFCFEEAPVVRTMKQSTPRTCLKRTLILEETDRIPCCFMSFSTIRNRCKGDRYNALLEELKIGFDPMMFIPSASRDERLRHPDLRGLPVHFHPEVRTEHWISGPQGNSILNCKHEL